MKKIILTCLTAGVLGLTSCGDFLTADNIYNKNLEDFYSTPTEITEAVASMYLAMYISAVQSKEELVMNYADDIGLGGGGSGTEWCVSADQFTTDLIGQDAHAEMWTSSYNGIYRANTLIEVLTDQGRINTNIAPNFESEAELDEFVAQALGEAYFMKGFFYFGLGRWFGGVPIINTTVADRYVGRSTFLETFSVAATNFKLAAETFPNKAATAYSSDDFGHANRWIAQGYLARTYLHATGYMTNIEGQATTEVPYYEMDGSLTKADAIAAIEDVRDNSGYALASDFRNLWPYAHANYVSVAYEDPEGDEKYPWVKQEGLVWTGQDGMSPVLAGTTGNPEVMFAKCAAFGNWNTYAMANTNSCMLFFGARNASVGPFNYGWGQGTTNPAYYESFEDGDLRRDGAILDLYHHLQADGTYAEYTVGDCADFTGYADKKHGQIMIDGSSNSKGMFAYLYDQSSNLQLWNVANYPLLRYSDILLMHSELTETATGMNLVRERAGLADTSYGLTNLMNERMWEFSYESIRYFDLVRWGALYTKENTLFDSSFNVVTMSKEVPYTVTPNSVQKGLRPIPNCEIELSLGVYEQNPGWNW